MGTATLTIDLNALRKNWRRLNAMSSTETGAVVKADAYGLGTVRVAQTLADEGARSFFVAVAEEGASGPGSDEWNRCERTKAIKLLGISLASESGNISNLWISHTIKYLRMIRPGSTPDHPEVSG